LFEFGSKPIPEHDADAAAESFIVLKGTINLTAGDFVL
jgi:quercetin dioxygenase-like cupin family protein